MNQEENIIQEDDMIAGEVEAPQPKITPMMAAMIALSEKTAGELTPNRKATILTEKNGDQYYWDPISQSYKKSMLTAKRKR